ncbi:Xylanase inhibitor, N-terminal [Dillenia turbinata]|uniref:Xylanase inhibitor, N-terminal n=1 Tax=Dillenia turbinata TaxID=194707 RepID=A0AAN8V532_9MAGN
MSTSCSSILFGFSLCGFLLCSLKLCYAFEGRETAETTLLHRVPNGKHMQVVHSHGPCFSSHGKSTAPTVAQVLAQDQSRVDTIHSRLSTGGDPLRASSATIPGKSGRSLGSGNYVVTVGFGTPKRDQTVIFDTGSDLTWIQCQPCVKSCYKQQEPIFNPSSSTSYSNVSCTSAQCSQLTSATGNTPSCSSSTCVYGIQYGDQSYSVGFFGRERITLTSTDAYDNLLFGCGQNNRGLFGQVAGLMGLGRDPMSIVSQTSQKYGKFFSYCLPSSSASAGYLAFGREGTSDSVQYTPSSINSQGPSFYFIGITGISVGGQKLSIPSSIFSNAGTIIDSGTVITRLPPTAYSALRTAFRQQMSSYPTAPALSLLDTCYDFSQATSVSIPKINFYFSGNTNVDIDASGILYANGLSQVCLAFAPNSNDGDVAIFGNTQQKTFQVVYDVAGGQVGFGAGGCK